MAQGPERQYDLEMAWTPKVCKILAFMAVIMGVRPLFYILLGFRYDLEIVGVGFGYLGVFSLKL